MKNGQAVMIHREGFQRAFGFTLYTIMEHYEDEAPEPFGDVALDHVPTPGEVIPLFWFDGREAHSVRVLRIDDADPYLVHARLVK